MLKCSKRNSSQGNPHPIAIGATVIIISLRGDSAFIDGVATIKGYALGDHSYWIRFVGDPRVRVRPVHPSLQRDAYGLVDGLNALLKAAREPDPDEFFPSDDDRPEDEK